MKSFGAFIKNARLIAQMTQRDASRALGKSGTTWICAIEKGEYLPREESLFTLATLYKIRKDDILIASGSIPKKYQKGATRNMRRLKNFLEKLQKI